MKKMKIAVTGANGQVAVDLILILRQRHHVYGFSKEMLDVTQMEQVHDTMQHIRPDVIIHTAAYTQVDLAEQEQTTAFRINAFGTRNVAVVAQQVGAKLVYLSTDYVFDGEQSTPYTEFDVPNPINVYGKSKLAGEEFVKTLTDKYFIVRTSWVYGKHGSNFVKTIVRLAMEQEELRIVTDQIGSPTYTVDLAWFLHNLVETCRYGVYHVTNAGQCSWFEFAREICDQFQLQSNVLPVTTAEVQRPAPRPAFSVLGSLAMKCNGFSELPEWRKSLGKFAKLSRI